MLARSLVVFAAAADAAAAAPKFIPITQLNTRQVRSGQQRPKKYDMLKEEDKLGRWRILRGDRVQVIAGDAKGETGVIKRVVRKKNMVLVENANMRTRIFKPNPEMRGRKFKREGLIHVSNVMLVDPKEKKPTRVKAMFTPSGRKLRVSKKSSLVIPRNKSRLVPTLKERYPSEASPFDSPLTVARQRTYRSTLEANGVESLQISRLRSKIELATAQAKPVIPSLPATYRAPLVTAAQVWALRIETRARERQQRRARDAQSKAAKESAAAAAKAAAAAPPAADVNAAAAKVAL